MARTLVNPFTALGSYPALPLTAESAHLALTAVLAANGGSFTSTGREVLVINNPTVGAITVTVHSAPDSIGRTGDITAYSIPAGEIHCLGPFYKSGWAVAGLITFDVSADGLTFAVLSLPSIS